jgi:hypothetical protein
MKMGFAGLVAQVLERTGQINRREKAVLLSVTHLCIVVRVEFGAGSGRVLHRA